MMSLMYLGSCGPQNPPRLMRQAYGGCRARSMFKGDDEHRDRASRPQSLLLYVLASCLPEDEVLR